MRPPLPLDTLLIAPLVLALIASAPWFRPVRRAFTCSYRPCLAPGEVLLARLRPDPGFVLLAACCQLAATGLVFLMSLPAGLALTPFATGGLVWLGLESRRYWLLTDRRIITGAGASLPLTQIRRCVHAPCFLGLDGPGTQRLRLYGLRRTRDAVQAILAPHPARQR